MKAIILAGGLGTRMQPYTFFIPKPMLPIANKPILEHIISWLKDNEIKDIVICVSYLSKIIEDYFKDGKELGVNIEYSKTDRPLGTAGQLKSAERFINDRFVCVYGDGLYEFSLKDMLNFHINNKAFITMALLKYSKRLDYGFIEINDEGRVTNWIEKPEYKGLINIGCYIMEPSIFKYIDDKVPLAMNEVFLKLLDKPIYGYIINEGFRDIGNKKDYKEVYKMYLRRLGNV